MGQLWLAVLSDLFPGTEPVRLLEGVAPRSEGTADTAVAQPQPTAA